MSLFKGAADPAAQAALEEQRARLRAKVATALARAAMVTEADEGAGLQAAAAAAHTAAVRAATACLKEAQA